MYTSLSLSLYIYIYIYISIDRYEMVALQAGVKQMNANPKILLREDRKGTNGVGTNGVTANFMFFDRRTFWVLR